jgi:hypothetical protein
MRFLLAIVLSLVVFASKSWAQEAPFSAESRSCLNCHRAFTPGIVQDWLSSRHSRTTPSQALKKPELQRRISATQVPQALRDVVVGCYECHALNGKAHQDNFSHFGFQINVVVSPRDCATCHPLEQAQYNQSKKAHAWGNLKKNPLYSALVKSIIGLKELSGTEIGTLEPSAFTEQEACFACHGTRLEVRGLKSIKTPLGSIQVPDIAHWPNQGVGRLNPDGSRGACTPCHPRHSFSIEIARKPHTCAQCHLEPDVPAWNVYAESKHGNIYLSKQGEWDFRRVPWRLGVDFTAPTCAACHNSLLVSPDGAVIAQRTHDFGARLWVRLFGLIYTHPQPRGGDTSVIRNADGLPLPTTFEGTAAREFLIDDKEQARRQALMEAVCQGCHSTQWVQSHFQKMHNTLRETDQMTLAATRLLKKAWELGLADPENPFDEPLEHLWIKQWLFYGNTARYASAMTGAPDYVAFKYGWWGLSTNLRKMLQDIKLKTDLPKK